MPAGRPRTTSFTENEMIQLGEEMLAWVKKHKKTILHLSEWYTIEKGFIYNEWKQFITKPEFHPYYEQALKIVGSRYLDKTSNVRENIAPRWQRVYFKDIRESEDEDLDADAARKASISKAEDTANAEKLKAVLEGIDRNKRVPQ